MKKFIQAMKEAKDNDLIKLPLDLALGTCANCNNCAEQCSVYQATREEAYLPALRSDLLRRVYKKHFTLAGKLFGKLVGAEDLDEDRLNLMAESFYRCTMCRRCALECPLGIDNMLITRTARTLLTRAGITPKILDESVDAQLKTGNVSKIPPLAFIDMVEFLEGEMKEATGREIHFPRDRCSPEILLIPPVVDFIMNAETMMGIAETLYAAGADWTLSTALIDSANFGVFFDDDSLVKIAQLFVEEAKKLKPKKVVIGECGHAYKAANKFYDLLSGPFPFQIQSVLELTASYLQQGKIKVNPEANRDPVTLHDPCNVARMGGIVEEPRSILQAVCKDFREMNPHGVENYCCGGGGSLVLIEELHDFRMEVSGKKKVEQIRATGARVVAAPCANCKKQLAELVEYYKLDVKVVGVHDLVGRALVWE